MRNLSSGFPTRSYINRAVQPQTMARGLKFKIQKVDGFYYIRSENEGADQPAFVAMTKTEKRKIVSML